MPSAESAAWASDGSGRQRSSRYSPRARRPRGAGGRRRPRGQGGLLAAGTGISCPRGYWAGVSVERVHENVLSPRGLRFPADDEVGLQSSAGKRSPREISQFPMCQRGWGAPLWRRRNCSPCCRGWVLHKGWRLAMPHPCCRSLAPPGMDYGRPRLSQSDSRLDAIELTELDSTTILSAYDST